METKLSDLIYLEKKFLTIDECKHFIDYYEKNSEIANSEASVNSYNGRVEESSFTVIKIEKGSKEHIEVRNKMKKALTNYMKYLDSIGMYSVNVARNFQYAHLFRILRYENGQKIHPHSDHDIGTYGSVVLNLTGDYVGGEFSFFNKKVRYNLGQGDLMVFPANDFFIHEVEPIQSGLRYSINSFIKKMPFEVGRIIENQVASLTDEYLNNTHPDKVNGPFFR